MPLPGEIEEGIEAIRSGGKLFRSFVGGSLLLSGALILFQIVSSISRGELVPFEEPLLFVGSLALVTLFLGAGVTAIFPRRLAGLIRPLAAIGGLLAVGGLVYVVGFGDEEWDARLLLGLIVISIGCARVVFLRRSRKPNP